MSAPSAPVIVVAPLASDSTLEFAWENPVSDGGSAITGFRFQLDNDTPISLGANAFYYQVTGLTNGQLYSASIEAQNANGYSTKAFFRPFSPGFPPNPPATGTAATSGSNNAMITWTAPTVTPVSPIFWYVLRSISTNPSDPEYYATADGVTQRSYLFSGLNINSAYTFDIQAVNCPGYSTALTTNSITWYTQGSAKLATRAGGDTTHQFSTVATDSAGNVYQLIPLTNTAKITLYNYDSAPSGGGAIVTTVYGTITAGATGNIILVKYNSNGAVQWATKFERFQSGDLPASVATDSAGNVYVSYANYNQSPVTFYNYSSAPVGGGEVGFSTYGTLSSPGLIFCVAKYNSSGQAEWATKVQSGNNLRFPAMNVDPNGNVYLCCFVGDTTTTVFSYTTPAPAGGSINLNTYGAYTKIGTYDAILVKYNTSGAAQWFASISAVATTNDTVCNVCANSEGDVYFSASSNTNTTVRSSVPVGGGIITTSAWGTISTSSGSGRGALIVKYNISGAAQWATRIVPVSNVLVRSMPYLSLDSNGNLYWMSGIVVGGTLTLYNYSIGGGGGTAIVTTSYGTVDAAAGAMFTPLIIKYTSSGSIVWANTVVSNESNGSFLPFKSVCDSAGNFYLVAYGGNRMPVYNFTSGGGGGAVSLSLYGYIPRESISSGNDVYIVKYDTNGDVLWGTSVAGTGEETFAALDIDNAGNVWVTGTYVSNPVKVKNYSSAPDPVGTGNMGLTTFGTLADITGAGDNVFLVKYAV